MAALLIHRAVGDRLTCIFVDNGLLRLNEAAQVRSRFEGRLGLNIVFEDAGERFLHALEGVSDPERKRKIIGGTFIDVFDEAARRLGQFDFLAQGTLYPDVIESVSVVGPAVPIKSHHNVGGLPERLRFALVEPLRLLFKDEVRRLGEAMGLDESFVWRHPFPGPGLAVRILGPVTASRLAILRGARCHRGRGGAPRRLVPAAVAVVRGAAAGPERRGSWADERTYEHVLRDSGGREPGRHDRRLGPVARRPPGRRLVAHRERGAGGQPGGVRHQQQAALDDRVGVRGGPSSTRSPTGPREGTRRESSGSP